MSLRSPTSGARKYSRQRRSSKRDKLVDTITVGVFEIGRKGYRQVGWGEFQPADGTREVESLRYLFLDQLRWMEVNSHQEAPGPRKLKVLDELARDPFDALMRAKIGKRMALRLASGDAGSGPGLRVFREVVREWARRWHMDSPWCLSFAYSTLWLWRNETARKMRLWNNSFPLETDEELISSEVVGNGPFQGWPTFYAHLELRKSYESRINTLIQARLKSEPLTRSLNPKVFKALLKAEAEVVEEYCDKLMRIYGRQRDDQGDKVWKKVATKPELIQRMRWTIEVRVRGTSANAIAQEETKRRQLEGKSGGLHASTVLDAVNYILDIIGLENKNRVKQR